VAGGKLFLGEGNAAAPTPRLLQAIEPTAEDIGRGRPAAPTLRLMLR
jgi:hypothetical protein